MESQPKNPEFRNNPENFHPCVYLISSSKGMLSVFIRITSLR